MNVPRFLQHALDNMVEKPPKALDKIAIPRDRVREVLGSLQNLIDAERRDDVPGARVLTRVVFWRLINEVLPATRGKVCRINTDHATHPLVEITGNAPRFEVGAIHQGRRVLRLWEFSSEQLRMVAILSDKHGPLAMYDLWTYIEREVMQGHAAYHQGLTITLQGDWQGVLELERKADEDEDEDEDDEEGDEV